MGNYGKPLQNANQNKGMSYPTEYNASDRPHKAHHAIFATSPISLYPPQGKPLKGPKNGLRIEPLYKPLKWRRKAGIAWQWWDIGQDMKRAYRGAEGLRRA